MTSEASGPVIHDSSGTFVQEAVRNWLDRFPWLYETYGPAVKVVSAGGESLFVFSPEHNREVLGNAALFHSIDEDNGPALAPEGSAMRRLGHSLLWLNGPRHSQHKRMMMPALNEQNVMKFRDVVEARTAGHVTGWGGGETRDVHAELRALTEAVSLDVLLGPEAGAPVAEALRRYLRTAFDRDASNRPSQGALAVAEEVERELKTLMERRRREGAGGADVLSVMLRKQQDGVEVTDDEIAGQTVSLYVSGFPSVASAIASVLFLLAQHPGTAAALLAELEAGPPPEPRRADTLLDRVIHETLRLFPGSFWGKRVATGPARVGPFELPTGAVAYYSAFVTHRIPALYAEPRRFLPERWRELDPNQRDRYFPFGDGMHTCVGMALGWLEMKLILPVLLRRFRFALVPGAVINRGAGDNTLPMLVHPQDGRFTKEPVEGNIHRFVDLG